MGFKQMSDYLVSVYQRLVSSGANNFVNFHPIFTNEVSKSKLRFLYLGDLVTVIETKENAV